MTLMTRILTAVGAAVLMLAPVQAEELSAAKHPGEHAEFTARQKSEIEAVIKDYLLNHPEVLQDAMAELEKRQAAAEAEKTQTFLSSNAATVFNSSRQIVLGNPNGNVTMVEFFDYNCGYCKRAMADMLDLLKSDPNLRIVLKEFPVLGPGSVEAAKVAVAVRMQGKDGAKYLEFHQKLLGGRGQADKARALAAAKDAGFDVAKIEADLENPEVKASLEETLRLGEQLGLNGTPSYIVGSDVVVGAVGLDALRGKISTARCGKAQCAG